MIYRRRDGRVHISMSETELQVVRLFVECGLKALDRELRLARADVKRAFPKLRAVAEELLKKRVQPSRAGR